MADVLSNHTAAHIHRMMGKLNKDDEYSCMSTIAYRFRGHTIQTRAGIFMRAMHSYAVNEQNRSAARALRPYTLPLPSAAMLTWPPSLPQTPAWWSQKIASFLQLQTWPAARDYRVHHTYILTASK